MQQEPHQPTPYEQLRELGFEEACIKRALEITNNIEKASQIALKLSDEGINADLSAYIEQKPAYKLPDKHARAKMLFIVNGELKMGKGKICAQVGHAVIGAFTQIEEEARYDERSKQRLDSWMMQGTAKVVVKADTQKQLLQIKDKFQKLDIGINLYLVEDAGHTQIKAGSKTVLGIGPAYYQEIDPITIHLKLL